MPTIHALAVANTVAGTPRVSATATYNGISDKTVTVWLVCPTWASADPAQTTTIEVQQSFDNGSTWAVFSTLTATGGQTNRVGDLPHIVCQCVDGLGQRKVRVVLAVDTGTLTAGVDVTT